MKEYNKTFSLPNPIPWHGRAIAKIKAASRWLVTFGPCCKGGRKKVFWTWASLSIKIDYTKVRQHSEIGIYETEHDRNPWTMEHGFYAMMFSPRGTNRYWFITLYGLRNMLCREDSRGSLPDLPRGKIMSKRKADGLAKCLVCMQTLWFISQCLTRCM